MSESTSPLADRVRPQSLSEFVGQEHLVGEGKVLRKLIESNQVPSLMFLGPPGSGKTTLARIIANETDANFVEFSAVESSVSDVRKVAEEAKERLKLYSKKTILFIDELHRFTKAQQDAFLPHVEKGTIILIGATTENPSFRIIDPLLSRSRVLVLEKLSVEQIEKIVASAIADEERGLGKYNVGISDEALELLSQAVDGDARVALNGLEVAVQLKDGGDKQIMVDDIREALQHKALAYDQKGEEHYNTISAFIKSMRASDIDAALYYLARMLEGGEDPLFIARRMVIFASEDVGMAQPTALVVANEVFRACETIGLPECAINLAHGVVYLAKAQKDRSSYNALRAAQSEIKSTGSLAIPMKLRNAVTELMDRLGYGEGYQKYSKDSYLPEEIKDHKYYFGDK
jgi:putative ATPase